MCEYKPCERCGENFEKDPRISMARWEKRKFCSKKCAGMRRSVSDNEIITLYEGGLSSVEVGELAGLSSTHIVRVIKGAGMQVRSQSEALTISHARPWVREKMSNNRAGIPCPESVKETLRQRIGPKNHNWRAGLTMQQDGYLIFSTSPANGEHAGRLLHRIIAEWKIDRPLREGEVVHHIDGDRLNNDPGNLQVLPSQSEHSKLHGRQGDLGRRKKCQVV